MNHTVFARINIIDYFPIAFGSFGELLGTLIPNLFILAGAILLVLLIIGGFGIILSAGKGEKEGIMKNRQLIVASLIGFLLIISSYWIIRIVSVITGLNILNPPI
jgi:hypothetical protein